MTIEFMNYIISYINRKFTEDSTVPQNKKVEGHLAYDSGLIKSSAKSFYVVQCLDKQPSTETLVDTPLYDISLQISIFSVKGTIGGQVYLPQQMSIKLSDMVSGYMEELKRNLEETNICLMREVGSSPALPFEDGARAYISTLRYTFTIMK